MLETIVIIMYAIFFWEVIKLESRYIYNYYLTKKGRRAVIKISGGFLTLTAENPETLKEMIKSTKVLTEE